MKKILLLLLSIILAGIAWANSSLEFDGQSSYVELSQLFNIGSSSFTVEAWVKIPKIGEGNLVSGERVGILFGNYGLGNANINFEVYSSGQTRYYWGNAEINEFGSKDLRDGAWHHLAFVRDKVNNKKVVYVDGVIDLESAGVGTDLNVSALHRIGNDNRSSGNPYFHGTIDELRVWNTARTQVEIREYMCEDVSGSTGLLANYRMSNDTGTSLTDNTGNGYVGTLYNMDNSDWVNDNQIPDGNGSSTPYQINGLNQLYWLSQNSAYWWVNDFEQITDINATATESWDGGAGFSPIGNQSNKFTASYDGNDHSISGLTINRPSTRDNALFGYLHSATIISYLHLINVNITGWIETGAISGTSYGTIKHCSASGNVSSTNNDIGGILSMNAGTVTQCYSSVTISTTGSTVGGLAGFNEGTITECIATGDVTGSTRVGGLVGWTYDNSTINNCYATGNINGDNYVGGFSGQANASSVTTNCYSIGSASGNSYVGGLIGYAEPEQLNIYTYEMDPPAEITGCFWDTQTSNQLTSEGGTGKTTVLMKTVSTFTDEAWDFEAESANGDDDIWDLDVSGVYNDGYPFLSWQNGSETALPIQLISFEAKQSHEGVLLKWQTGSETENAGFIVERKAAAGEWEKLGDYRTCINLEGHGTSSEIHNYEYLDQYVLPGNYNYRISDVDYQGKIKIHNAVEITVREETIENPEVFGLKVAYPNPFNPTLSLEYDIVDDAQTKIAIYDLNGKLISILENSHKEVGHYDLVWNASNVPSGIYVIKLVSGTKIDLRKVSLMK